MRTRFSSLFLWSMFLSVLIVGSSCKKEQAGSKKDESTSSDKEDSDWKSHTSEAGRFTARFLGGSKEKKLNFAGAEWTITESVIGSYAVHFADYPSEAGARSAQDVYLKSLKKKNVQAENDISFEGQKTTELVVKVNDTTTMWMRTFLVGPRFYKVAAGNKNRKENADKFFSFFKLKSGT